LGFFGCAKRECVPTTQQGNGDQRCDAVFSFHLLFPVVVWVSAFVVMAESLEKPNEIQAQLRLT
jgi:hypothetical protein